MSQNVDREVEQNGLEGGQHPDDFEFQDLVRGPDGKFVGDDERGSELIDDGDMVEGVAEERGERPGKGRGRRVVGGLFALLLLGVVAIGVWYAVGNGATRRARVPVNGNAVSSNATLESEAAMTQRALDQAGVSERGVVMSDGSVVYPVVEPTTLGAAPSSSLPVTQVQSPVLNTDLSSTVNSAPAASGNNDGAGDAKQNIARTVTAEVTGRNNERSVIIGEEVKAAPESRPVNGDVGSVGQPRQNEQGVVLPSFGSMLPVKSLGVLYTLRSGGLVRLELSREVKGKGWSMPKGTVLVGVSRGAEYNRAFVSLVGFIDSESGQFVKVGGDLLGSDGGVGIRGERRKMTSSWSRVLSKMGEASLRVAEGLAGSVGRRPIVVTDAFGGYGGRVTNELDGALLGRDRDRDIFVEVAAGSQGYIMITDLPEAIQGVDALSKLSSADLRDRSDVSVPRQLTGISEQELAELIQSGDVERIRAAMPRMRPEMRRVAEAVVSGELSGR
jgi:hypothetical protein